MAVRPGWLLPALALGGLAAGIKGLTMLQAVSAARNFCQALATIGSLLPRGLGTTANCASVDSRYNWGLAIAVIGLVAVIVAGIGLARRSDRASLSPTQLEPTLRRLLDAAPNPTLTALLPCAGPCPVTLYGHLNGYPVVGIAFWHPLLIKHQRPPSGAFSLPHRGGHLFYLGSDITIGAASPNPDR